MQQAKFGLCDKNKTVQNIDAKNLSTRIAESGEEREKEREGMVGGLRPDFCCHTYMTLWCMLLLSCDSKIRKHC